MPSAATESSSPRPAPQIGGQYRLAGLQPTRQQVLDHIDWYARQLAQLGVDVRLDTPVDGAWIAAAGAEIVVVATGALPARAGFQRAAPMSDRLPGVDARNVASIEDVLEGGAAPGGRVLLLDDLGDWRGIGTAMFLQERGCDVCHRDVGADRRRWPVPQRGRRAGASAIRARRW